MFTSAIRYALFTLALSAISVSAAQSVSLKITGPKSVDTVEHLKVTTTIANTGDETLKLLNDPLSPLSKLPANTFKITGGPKDASPRFTGIKAKYVPERAAADHAYTILAPGESVNVEHDLSGTYNFSGSGEGSYLFGARNLFYAVDDTAKLTLVHATIETHTARISGKLAVSRPTIRSRSNFNGCSSTQQTGLGAAASAAQNYVTNALSYLQSHNSSTPRFATWFGTYSSDHHSTVLSHFSHINSTDFSAITYDCTCTASGTFAYVYPAEFGYIYLCGAFWRAPNTGTDSRGGTLIHESSHFTANGGTEDYVYGQSASRRLAISDPTSATGNADSHEYFVENNPVQS